MVRVLLGTIMRCCLLWRLGVVVKFERWHGGETAKAGRMLVVSFIVYLQTRFVTKKTKRGKTNE